MVLRRDQFLSQRRQQLLAETRSSVLLAETRTRPTAGWTRGFSKHGRSIQLHSSGFPEYRLRTRTRSLDRPSIQECERDQPVRLRADFSLAEHQRKFQQGSRPILRRRESVSGKIKIRRLRFLTSAGPTLSAERELQHSRIR